MFLAEMNFPFLPCQCWPEEKAAGRVTRRCCSPLAAFLFHLAAKCELKSGTIEKSLSQAKMEAGATRQPSGHGDVIPFCWAGICVWCLEIVYLLLSAGTEFKHSAVQWTLDLVEKQNLRCGNLVGVKLNWDVNITTLRLHKSLECMLGFNMAWWLC